jgi:GntR family transcriptional regulator
VRGEFLYCVHVHYTVRVKPEAPLTIDLASLVPAYRQIVDGIRAYLVEGVFRPGDSLPSVRRLAADLGIHFNTVAKAYGELAAEGWLEVSHGRSVLVVERNVPSPDPAAATRFRSRIRSLVAEAIAEGVAGRTISGELRTLAEKMS